MTSKNTPTSLTADQTAGDPAEVAVTFRTTQRL